ncbi:hypothetical protein [Microcoleus sp. CAWBG58]|uniref:hypothetical protein n=1 Tax=Microcoleus sp. CAWBG58 TaxID=2841651 RepID=UPI0025D6D49F|nr:hypothetical protein [Microcoleus sp. CAWBG58]
MAITDMAFIRKMRYGELGIGNWELGIGNWELGIGNWEFQSKKILPLILLPLPSS